MNFLPFIFRRAARHWQILLPLILGVIISTALLSSGPILVDSVLDFALTQKLRTSNVLSRNLRLTTYDSLGGPAYESLDRQIREDFSRNFGLNLEQVVSNAESNWVHPWFGGEPVGDNRVNLRFYQDIQDHVTFVAGSWPRSPVFSGDTVRAVIGESLADAYTLDVGDRLPVSVKTDGSQPDFWIEVAGIVRPDNPRDDYWFGEFNPLRAQRDQRYAAKYAAIIPQETFPEITQQLFPAARSLLIWHGLLNSDSIRLGDSQRIAAGLAQLRADLDRYPQRFSLETNLIALLEQFSGQAEVVSAPLYLLIVEVLFLALYYVTMVAALSMGQVEGEYATLSSRGASGGRILHIQAIEAVLIGLTALLSGPGLAAALIWALAQIGPLADFSQSALVTRIPQAAWVAAGIGALAGVLGLLFPVGSMIKRSIVAYQRSMSRNADPPWWQRYYLDVFLTLAGLLLLWRLNVYGGLLASEGGQVRVDWLLLLSPLALLIGSATILLRLFPIILALIAKLAARGKGLPAALAMWQVSRNPTHLARLVLLLTLAMSLGILSTGLNATLDLSESERARYATGGDLRMVFDQFTSLLEVDAVSGVDTSSAVWRGEGRVNVRSYRNFPSFEVIAVEPFSFSAVTEVREDFTTGPFPVTIGNLVTDSEVFGAATYPLPGQPRSIGIWAATADPEDFSLNPIDYLTMKVKLVTALGEVLTFDLEPGLQTASAPVQPETEGQLYLPLILKLSTEEPAPLPTVWRYYAAALPPLDPQMYPLQIHSFWLRIRTLPAEFSGSQTLKFALDDLVLTEDEGDPALIGLDFEDPTLLWQSNEPQVAVNISRLSISRSGEGSLSVHVPAFGAGLVSVSLADLVSREALPALVSDNFLNTTSLQVGDEFLGQIEGSQIKFVVRESVHYFPTLYAEEERSFLITALDPLITKLNQTTHRPVNYNEVWTTTSEQQNTTELLTAFPEAIEAWDLEEVRRTFKADPLSLGLRSVTFIGYAVTAMLSLIGFSTHFYMSARRRGTAYGVLRSIGLSPRQLYGSLVLEQVILILAGLALGTGLGVLLNRLVLPRLPIALGDRPPVPPFIPKEDWFAVGELYLMLAGVFFLVLALATIVLWRARIHQVLRVGQE